MKPSSLNGLPSHLLENQDFGTPDDFFESDVILHELQDEWDFKEILESEIARKRAELQEL